MYVLFTQLLSRYYTLKSFGLMVLELYVHRSGRVPVQKSWIYI